MSNVLLLEPTKGHNASKHQEREGRNSRPVHVRALDQPVEETATAFNIDCDGLSFTSSRNHYSLEMPLFLSLSNSAGSVRYLGEVVGIEVLPNGSRAIAVRFAPNCN